MNTLPETVNPKLVITLDDLVVEFASNFSLGMKAISAAAETYVTALRKYPSKARDEFSKHFPSIRPDTWRIIEDIGNGKLPPQATMMTNGAVEKLRDAKLPKRLSLSLAKQKVSVYNPSTKTFADIPFTHLTESQADIVLNPVTHSIRDADQQKRYVNRILTSPRIVDKPKTPDWIFAGDGILIKRTTHISISEMKEIISTIERNTITA